MARNATDVEPIDPRTAQELYLDHKGTECTDATVQNHRQHIRWLVRWCDETDIDNLNRLTGRDLQEFRLWRKEQGDINLMTLNNFTSAIRVFLKWAGSVEAVRPNLHEKVIVPQVSPSDDQSDAMLEADDAEEILEYLETYHYASDGHVVFALLWETGMRIGALRSIDLVDVDCEQEHVTLVHRPDEGTTLKNGASGERPVAITPELATVVGDYIDGVRIDQTDEYGREPLITTTKGRISRSSIRRHVYRVTAPCFRNEPCLDCAETPGAKCGGSVNPHAIRRGSITHYLINDVPVEIVSDRMNVSRDVLDKHYDRCDEEEKLEQRRGYLGDV